MSDNPFVSQARQGGKTAKQLQQAFDDGEARGLMKGRQEIFDWLEAQYIHAENRPDRGTPEANAILKLVTEARDHFMPSARKAQTKRERPKK